MVIFGFSDKLKKRAKRRELDALLMFSACSSILFCIHRVNKFFNCMQAYKKREKNEKTKR